MTEPSDFERPDGPTDVSPDDVDSDELRADELASAFVDGELTAEEAAEVRSNPDLMARVAEFEAVSASTSATPAPAAAATKAAHIAAAMAVFGAGTPAEASAVTQGRAVTEEGAVTQGSAATGGSADIGGETAPTIDLAERRQQRAERGNRMLLALAAAFVVVGGIGLASWGLGSSSDDDVAIAADDAGGSEATTVSPSNAGAASEALEAEAMADDAMADDEAMEEESMDEAMEDDEAGAAESSEIIESDEESGDFDTETADTESATTTTAAADEPFGALRLVGPPADLTIDDLFAQSETAEPLPLEESLCAAELGIGDGVWYIVENADGSGAEFVVEFAADGTEIGRLVDETCSTVLE